MKRTWIRLALVAALVAPLGGCFPKSWVALDPFLVQLRFLVFLAGGDPWIDEATKTRKMTFEEQVEVTGNVGGLDGTYDLTLGTYGAFSGTAKVKRQRFVTLKVADTPELRAAMDAALTDALGANVSVSKAKGKLKALQTPGGVKVKASGTLSFQGSVDDGPNAPRTFRGTLKIKGEDPPPAE